MHVLCLRPRIKIIHRNPPLCDSPCQRSFNISAAKLINPILSVPGRWNDKTLWHYPTLRIGWTGPVVVALYHGRPREAFPHYWFLCAGKSNGFTWRYTDKSGEVSLQWRHNGRDGVSNHQPHHCWLNRLFMRRSKKTSKLRVTGLCAGNSPVTDEFPHK